MKNIKKKLGADKVVRTANKNSGTLLDWLHLSKIISSGGRPSDPNWTIKRLVPFKKSTWNKLEKESKGKNLSPAQLTARIIERVVA